MQVALDLELRKGELMSAIELIHAQPPLTTHVGNNCLSTSTTNCPIILFIVISLKTQNKLCRVFGAAFSQDISEEP